MVPRSSKTLGLLAWDDCEGSVFFSEHAVLLTVVMCFAEVSSQMWGVFSEARRPVPGGGVASWLSALLL